MKIERGRRDAETKSKSQIVKIFIPTLQVEDYDSLYPEMGQYLNKTGKRVLYECLWPSYSAKQGRKVGE